MRVQAGSVMMVNVWGGAVACALAGLGIWHVFLRPHTASSELRKLRAVLVDKTRDLAALEQELDRQETLREERRQALAEAGTPAAQASGGEHLRTFIGLVRRNEVQLAEVTPLGTVSYPGVVEERHRIRGSGKYADLVRVLEQFEDCTFWGDVTYLQFGRAKNSPGPQAEQREVDLTVSFYSPESESREGGPGL